MVSVRINKDMPSVFFVMYSFLDIVTAFVSESFRLDNVTFLAVSKPGYFAFLSAFLIDYELHAFVNGIEHFSPAQTSAIKSELEKHSLQSELTEITDNTTVAQFLGSVACHNERDAILQIVLDRITEDTLQNQHTLHTFFLFAKQSGFHNIISKYSALEFANTKALKRYVFMYKNLICRFLAKYPLDLCPFVFTLLQYIFDNYKRTFMEKFVRLLVLGEPSLSRLIGIINQAVWRRLQTVMSILGKMEKYCKAKHMVYGDITNVLDFHTKYIRNSRIYLWPVVYVFDAEELYDAGLWIDNDYGMLFWMLYIRILI